MASKREATRRACGSKRRRLWIAPSPQTPLRDGLIHKSFVTVEAKSEINYENSEQNYFISLNFVTIYGNK